MSSSAATKKKMDTWPTTTSVRGAPVVIVLSILYESGYWNSDMTEIKEHMTLHTNKQVPISGDTSSR